MMRMDDENARLPMHSHLHRHSLTSNADFFIVVTAPDMMGCSACCRALLRSEPPEYPPRNPFHRRTMSIAGEGHRRWLCCPTADMLQMIRRVT